MTERHHAALVSAILNAIMDARRIPETGEYLIDPSEATTCLAVAIATIMEADPSMVTPKQMRNASETIARQVRLQMRFIRDEFERTGERPWDARVIPVN